MGEPRSNQTVVVASIVCCGLAVCCLIASNCFVRVKGSREVIRVTGSTHMAIHSDTIIWKGQITDRAKTQAMAYSWLKIHVDRLKTYLAAKGVAPSEIFPLAIDTTVIHPAYSSGGSGEPVQAYELTEAVEVRSKRVDMVDRIARESTDIISGGIAFQSGKPQYIYSQLGDLKLTILAAAAKDAHDRAERIARNTGCQVGQLRHARMGVLQIEGLYDSEGVTDTGANDTASLDKKCTAIVSADFAIR